MIQRSVVIFIEQRDGRAHPASLQLLTAARELLRTEGGAIHVVVVGEDVDELAAKLAGLGPTSVQTIDHPSLRRYRARPYAAAVAGAIAELSPSVVLLATTFMGRDLAPRVAVRTTAGLTTDCVGFRTEGDRIVARRTAYSGRCVAEHLLDPASLQIISIRPNSFPDPQAPAGASAPIGKIVLSAELFHDDVEVLDVVRSAAGAKDVAEADVVVAGGRSLKSEANFRIIEDLAEALDGAVGASRAAVDAGYQPHSRQVGLTGKVVTPKLYIACGIDGAIQHLAGMRGSKVIVAINTNRGAPIFEHATYGCVEDLFTLVPLLTAEAQKLKSR